MCKWILILMYKVVDNFFPQKERDQLVADVTNEQFAWHKYKGSFSGSDDDPRYREEISQCVFTHPIYHRLVQRDPQFCNVYLLPLMEALDSRACVESTFSFYARGPYEFTGGPHCDLEINKNALTALYYLEDNNGGTIIYENGEEIFIHHKDNRMVFMTGDTQHSAVIQTDAPARRVWRTICFVTDKSWIKLFS